jgi:hypothetical protein
MGDAFPSMVRELDAKFGARDERDPLSATVDQTLTLIGDQEALFQSSHEATARMLAELRGQLDTLGTLSTRVEAVREDSELMELISLNALVIAVKAGDSGRAFSCITAELKELTGQTMDLTDEIARGEATLDRVFGEFQGELGRLDDSEQSEFAAFLSRVRGVFEGLNAAAARLWGGLESIRQRSDEVKVPLVRIMVDIQNQDRVRQGIDHVLLSLREFQNVDESGTVEQQLDELSFLEILPELASQVLVEISGQIASNREAFHKSLTEARRTMAALESDRAVLLSEHLESRREGSLEHWFQVGQQTFESFVAQVEGASRGREQTFRRSASLQRHVGELVESFRSFDFVLSKFRNIDLASRIQVARQAALASMKDNATEMSALTRKIEHDVGEAMGITNTFFQTVERLFHLYREQAGVRLRQDQGFNSSLRDTLVRLQQAKDEQRTTVQNSRVFTRSFTELFARTEDDLKTLDALLAEIESQRRLLADVKGEVTERKRLVLARAGLGEWNLESDKLKAMIGRFTIFTHKKIAAGLGDFEVEESMESGEVTLF